ncbi:SH3 domain-containing protein [Flavobacterium procerum]|uniref:SH3 domain-containing protein n=1 Tax=Flavobacterium procerum TaxID=1455569 RepID=A0ABV6BYK6_9FLAO
MKRIILFVLILCFSCANKEKHTDKNNIKAGSPTPENSLRDSVKPNYQYKDLYKMREDIVKGLKSKGYKIPSVDFFRKRIEEVSGIDITKGEYDDPDFGKYKTLALVVRDMNILLPVDIDAKVDDKYIDHIINYNNMVIYDQITAVMHLEKFDQDCNVYTYIAGTGYTGNEKFLLKAFEWIKGDEIKRLEELLLGYTGQPNIIPHGPFRYEMLKKIQKLNPGIMGSFSTTDFSKYKLEYNESNKALAYIFDAQISCEYDENGEYTSAFGVYGPAEDYFKSHPEYLKSLRDNNYYGLEKLKTYATVIFLAVDSRDVPNYIVVDADGYVNLREEKNSSSKILEKVKTGEKVYGIENVGDWYRVRTLKENIGYIHKNKLKIDASKN